MEVAGHYTRMEVRSPDIAADENAILLQPRGSSDNDDLAIRRERNFALKGEPEAQPTSISAIPKTANFRLARDVRRPAMQSMASIGQMSIAYHPTPYIVIRALGGVDDLSHYLAVDVDHAHEACGELIVAGGDCAVDFQTVEHALDAVRCL